MSIVLKTKYGYVKWIAIEDIENKVDYGVVTDALKAHIYILEEALKAQKLLPIESKIVQV